MSAVTQNRFVRTRDGYVSQCVSDYIDAAKYQSEPGETFMEMSEAADWFHWDKSPQPYLDAFNYACNSLSDAEKHRIDRLLERVMRDISLDDMAELRDALRSALRDQATRELDYSIKEELSNMRKVAYDHD